MKTRHNIFETFSPPSQNKALKVSTTMKVSHDIGSLSAGSTFIDFITHLLKKITSLSTYVYGRKGAASYEKKKTRGIDDLMTMSLSKYALHPI